jgi:hypothetical protein
MKKYDPFFQPDSREWLSMDELARIDLVVAYHKLARQKMPDVKIHAAFHVIVENQLAEEFTDAVDALRRLLEEGLDRHDAIHAIASVLARHVHSMLKGDLSKYNINHPYFRDLNNLTVESWLSSGE